MSVTLPVSRVNYLTDIVYGIANVLGIDYTHDLLKDHTRAWADAINTRLRYAWDYWDWPSLTVTEERAFRQVWYTDVDYTAAQGDLSEVYYAVAGKYYRAILDPPVGVPPSSTTYWQEIPFSSLDHYIAYSQNGKQDMDNVLAVYNTSPRTGIPAIQWDQAPSGLGLDISWLSGPTVWVTYKIAPAKFSTTTYQADASYSRGAVVLDLGSGDCYVSLQSSRGKSLSLAAYWLRQEFPEIFADYVKYGVAADQSDDLPTKDRLEAKALDFMQSEADKLIGQGQRHRYWQRNPVIFPLGTSQYRLIPIPA